MDINDKNIGQAKDTNTEQEKYSPIDRDWETHL